MNKRQYKKMKLGYKMGKSQLRRRVNNVKILYRPRTLNDGSGLSDEFCPFCGCDIVEWTGNMTAYPYFWEAGYCARCGKKVIEADNSPYKHILREISEDKISI